MSPSPAADPGQVANTIVTWSGFVLAGFSLLLTLFTAILLLAGIFGLREIRGIRRAGEEVGEQTKKVLRDANELLQVAERDIEGLMQHFRTEVAEIERDVEGLTRQLRAEVAGIDGRMNSVVEVSYLFNQGELAYRAGEYLRAVDHLGRAVLLDPKNARVLYRLGRALTNAGDEVAAPDRFHEMRALGEHSGDPQRGLAWVYRYRDPQQALRYAQEATTVDDRNHHNWNCLGMIQRDAGDISASLRSHERAAGLKPDSAVTPFYLALLRARQGAERQARTDCLTAVDRLRAQEQRSPVKSIWSDVILWANCVLADDYDTADEFCTSVAARCTSRRRAREVGGHMDFLLRSLRRESHLRRYLEPIETRWPPEPGE